MFPNNLLKGTLMRLMSAAQCLCRAESMEYLTMKSCSSHLVLSFPAHIKSIV